MPARSGVATRLAFTPGPTMRPQIRKSMTDRSTGGPGNHVEVLDLVPRCDSDPLRAEPLDLPSADGPQLGRAKDPFRCHHPEPGDSRGLLDRERREDEGNLAGRDPQVLTDGPVGGDSAFRDGGHNRQDAGLFNL